MHQVTCSHCGGSGYERRGEMLPLDLSYDFRQGFQNYCFSAETREARIAEYAEKAKALLAALRPGDWFTTSGQFDHQVVDVGMYDGWPYWKPTPAVSYIGPLKTIEYAFYYNCSPHWKHKPSGELAEAK